LTIFFSLVSATGWAQVLSGEGQQVHDININNTSISLFSSLNTTKGTTYDVGNPDPALVHPQQGILSLQKQI
jgi:hypothetical protein